MAAIISFEHWPICLLRHLASTYLTMGDRWILRFVNKFFYKLTPGFGRRYYDSEYSMLRHCAFHQVVSGHDRLQSWLLTVCPKIKTNFDDGVGRFFELYGLADAGQLPSGAVKWANGFENPIVAKHGLMTRWIETASWDDLGALLLANGDAHFNNNSWQALARRLAAGQKYPAAIQTYIRRRCVGYQLKETAAWLDPDALDNDIFEEAMQILEYRRSCLINAVIYVNKPFLTKYVPKYYTPELFEIHDSDIDDQHRHYIEHVLNINIKREFPYLSHQVLEAMSEQEFKQQYDSWRSDPDHSIFELKYKLTELATSTKLRICIPDVVNMLTSTSLLNAILKNNWPDKLEVIGLLIQAFDVEDYALALKAQIDGTRTYSSLHLCHVAIGFEWLGFTEADFLTLLRKGDCYYTDLPANIKYLRHLMETRGHGSAELCDGIARRTGKSMANLREASCTITTADYFEARRDVKAIWRRYKKLLLK